MKYDRLPYVIMNFLGDVFIPNTSEVKKTPAKQKSYQKRSPKPKLPLQEAQITTKLPMIPPSLFAKQLIFLDLKSENLEAVKRALKSVNATITDYPKIADVIIAEDHVIRRELPLSRGAKISKIRNPSVIHLEQIPWVFDPIFSKSQEPSLSITPYPPFSSEVYIFFAVSR